MSTRQTKQEILALLTKVLRDSAEMGSKEELVFGEDLEDLLYTASAEADNARKFMQLLSSAVLKGDDRGLDLTIKALKGSVSSLTKVAESVGRFYGNPSRRLRSASAERVVDRYLENNSE